jgi:hypothetical protein
MRAGYCWFRGQPIAPLFGFGFGLPCTTFEISEVSVAAS